MIRWTYLLLFFMTGCVSYTEMQERAPALEVKSTKAPDAYAGCVSPKFMEIWPGMVTIIPDGDKKVVTVASAGGSVTATLTIAAAGSGSHVILREMPHINLGSGFKRGQAAVQACK